MSNRQSFFGQLTTIFRFLLSSELANKERLLAPVMFSGITLILISFGVGELPQDIAVRLYNTKLFVTLILALSLYFARIFDLDRKDGIHELMRTYQINHFSWFTAKFLLVFLVSWSTCLPTFFFAKLFSGLSSGIFDNLLETLLILSSALAGLSALGVLLSAICMNAESRAVLFPVLFFPLSVPVLLAGLNCNSQLMDGNWKGLSDQWFQLLFLFNLIYITLGAVLFAETVET